ncbi:hypothetical protein GR183_17240 [Stappia sp. GBMRC 2046]|uniref:Transposase zinc-ribbon domain-containing protein n=1 Tax=Stappia sediminis TaxID=2692190 RepID=A0A7X3LWW8_9HYPH|nr:transposase [Stappia sediminis]MXN66664.1 hypothetical protein [Stappia sediminis]
MSLLSLACFRNEEAAYEFVESKVWPRGPVCPHCQESSNIRKLNGSSTRIGTYKCYGCLKPFTVKIGTVFEASRLPLHVWLQSIYLIAQADHVVPARELERALGVSPKTAKVLTYRLQKAIYSSVARIRPSLPAGSGPTPRLSMPPRTEPRSEALERRRATALEDIFSAFHPV